MKIAFVVHTAYPEFIGGREHHIHHLAAELAKSNEVYVIAGGSADPAGTEKINGYHLIRLPMLSIRVSRNPLQIYRIVRGVYKTLCSIDPDIIHAFEYGSNTTDIAYMYVMFKSKPLVLTVYLRISPLGPIWLVPEGTFVIV